MISNLNESSVANDKPRSRSGRRRGLSLSGCGLRNRLRLEQGRAMSLYIRLQSSFWNNRKTLRLKAKIGDSAYWIPPRLWSYAADNQPNGDFSDYSDQEIAMLLGYQADAQALLVALHACGFLKDRKIHDWREHNGYHTLFSLRAKKAATVRWEKTRQDKKGKEKSEHSLRNAQASASNGSRPLSFPNGLTNSEWLSQIKQEPAYKGIDVQREHDKMIVWCKEHRVSPTRKRFVNWLNRADKPLGVRPQPETIKKIDPSKIEVPERFKSWVAEKYPDKREEAMKWQTYVDVPSWLRIEWKKETIGV